MKTNSLVAYFRTHRLLAFGLIALGFGLIALLLAEPLPLGVDWVFFFRPAALKLLMFQSPYDVWGFPSPPWALLPMLPFAILPSALGRAGWLVLSWACLPGASIGWGLNRWRWPHSSLRHW